MAATDDAEIFVTDREVLTETTEFTGELISIGPRFVQLDDDFWVDPDHVTAVERRITVGSRVYFTGGDGVNVAGPPEEVLALLLADEADE